MSRQPQHFLQSLARGVRVLEAFSAHSPRLTLQQLADRTGYNKTAVQRLTDTLMQLGYLGRNGYKEFFLEPKVLSLGFAYLHGSELRQLGQTHLADFGRRIGRTVNLAILEGTEVVFIYRHQVQTFFTFSLAEGSRLPVHCTALGKVLLAWLPPDDLDRRLAAMTFEPLTSRTITDRELFRRELATTAQRGYAVTDGEGALGLCSLAVPLIDRDGRVAAAINISLPSDEIGQPAFADLPQALLDEGRRLSNLLGYSGAYPPADLNRGD